METLILLACYFLVFIVVMGIVTKIAPEGYEDEDGFHKGGRSEKSDNED